MQRLAFIFPGQGSQKKGMGQDLYYAFPIVKEIYDEADSIMGYSLSQLSFRGPEERLQETEHTQPAVLTNSWAIASLLKDLGLLPTYAAGHSLGEYTALLLAGVFNFSDALGLVRLRGELMEKACAQGQGSMAAILGLANEEVASLCQTIHGVVVPANYNAPGQVVISGEKAAVAEASMLAKERGAKRVIPLKVSGPFHSPLMEEATIRLEEEIKNIPLRSPSLEVVANTSALPLKDVEEIRKNLVAQLVSPVRWEESMVWMLDKGVDLFIEVGPSKVLKGLMRYIRRGATAYHVEDLESLEIAKKALLA